MTSERSETLQDQNIEAYPILFGEHKLESSEAPSQKHSKMMLLRCRYCDNLFDSTFAAEDFAFLSIQQNESGTVHLCPHCGHLSIYLLKDYLEDGDKMKGHQGT